MDHVFVKCEQKDSEIQDASSKPAIRINLGNEKDLSGLLQFSQGIPDE
jgi:hypothetical protein